MGLLYQGLQLSRDSYLDESTGTPPTDWTQVAPNALAIRPSLLQRDNNTRSVYIHSTRVIKELLT